MFYLVWKTSCKIVSLLLLCKQPNMLTSNAFTVGALKKVNDLCPHNSAKMSITFERNEHVRCQSITLKAKYPRKKKILRTAYYLLMIVNYHTIVK